MQANVTGYISYAGRRSVSTAKYRSVVIRILESSFVFLLTTFLACTSSVGGQRTAITIEELPATDSWLVTMRFRQPVDAIAFVRPTDFRAKTWKIIAPAGARWNGDRIALPHPASEVVLELPTDTRELEKDYSVNFAFTDGSRLLYNGHIRTGKWPHTWTFRSPRTIRVLDRVASHQLAWDKDHDTYVYFGSIEPVRSDRMTLIVDPGLPPWIAQQMRELAPRQLDYFAGKLGKELSFKPLVLLSYRGAETSGFSFQGGTLPGLIQIAVGGTGWNTSSAEGTRFWFKHLAHEIFHLTGNPEDDAEWFSEAAADHAAFMAMRDLGVIDEATRRRLIVEASNECIVKLEGKPLAKAAPRNYYTCGVVLIERLGAEQMWTVYRRLFVKEYTNADLLATFPASEASLVRRILNEGPGMPTDRFLADQLQAAGIRVTRVPPASATATHDTLRWMLSATVSRCACRTNMTAHCGRRLDIRRVNDVDARRNPVAAYDSLLAGLESTVVIGRATETFRCAAEDADPTYERLLAYSSDTP